LSEVPFANLVRRLDAASFMVKAGTLIDASRVEAAAHRPAESLSAHQQERRTGLRLIPTPTEPGAARNGGPSSAIRSTSGSIKNRG
jgi:hypothetical protein